MTRHEYGMKTGHVSLPGFLPHGEANFLYAEDDLLVIHATGPFNREFMERLAVTETSMLETMSRHHAQWYALVTIFNSLMMTPDALSRYIDFRRAMHARKLGPRAIAFILDPQVEGGEIMYPHLSKLYTECGIAFAEFAHEDEARGWLQQLRAS